MSWRDILKNSDKQKLLEAINWLLEENIPNEIVVNWDAGNFNEITEEEAKQFIGGIRRGEIADYNPEGFFIELMLDREPFNILEMSLDNVWTYDEKIQSDLEDIVLRFRNNVR